MTILRTLLIGLTLAVALLLTGCQSSGAISSTRQVANADTLKTRVSDDYVLDTGDKVKVTVFGQPDLSGEFEVDGTGTISMPLIGQISVLGLSTPALEETITTKLADGYLREPRVTAEVTNYRPFYMYGEIGRPGEYQYSSGLTVLNAVAAAGGFTYRANKNVVYIKSADGADEERFKLTSQVMVQPGDTIRIGERIF